MSRIRPSRLRIITILAVLGVVAGVTTGMVMAGQKQTVTVTAMFDDAFPLIPGNVVKASGVDVGTVQSVSLQNGKAKVEMNVEQDVLPLHKDARATITTQDLLGERFVNLDRGSPAAPSLGDPPVLSGDQTNRVVDLQDILNSVDNPTSTALAALLTTSGEGLRDQGPQAAAAVAALQPAMKQSGELASILSDQNALLTHLVDSAQPVAKAMASDRGRNLDQLVGSTNDTLSTVAANQQAVRDSLAQLPSTMASARNTLAQVAGVTDPTTRTLASLRPVTNDLTNISGELRRFSDAADPALASLPPVLNRANAMLDEAGPLVKALQPAGPSLRGVSSSGRTLAEQALNPKLNDLMEFVKGWSMATSDYDAISHYFKAFTPYTPKAVGQTAAGPVPGLPQAPVPSLPLPAAPSVPLPGKSDNPPPPPAPGGSATGLTQNQENSMMGQLLGGS